MFEKIENFIQKRKKLPSQSSQGEKELEGFHIAMLATNGFEQSELFEPKRALEAAGAVVHIISLKPGKIRAWNKTNWGKSIAVDMTVREAWSMEFDSLVLPGGVLNPDKLRADPEAVAFVMSFVNKHRSIAAICHGIQTLIETGALKGRTVTSWPSLKTDVENAGARWIDQKVVEDHHFITSRRPSDIPAFNEAMIKAFQENRLHTVLPSTEGFATTL